jgi:hypothetical protein
MDKIDVIVSVSDLHLWCMKPFAFLFNKYWDEKQHVIVAGYKRPDFELPSNFDFYSIADPQYPKERWADGVAKFLHQYPGKRFVFMLEDYWLSRPVDTYAIEALSIYMERNPNVLRMDLTADRQFAGGMVDVGYCEHYDIIEAPQSQYQMSLQAGLWDRNLMLNVLEMLPVHLRSAWEVELTGTTIVNSFGDKMIVRGTRQLPVRYANGLNNAAGHRIFYEGLDLDDANVVREMVPQEYK